MMATKPSSFLHWRLVILCLTTVALTFAMCNPLILNFTIICMRDPSGNRTGNFTHQWSTGQQSTALSAFAWGAIASIVPLSVGVQKFGTRLILTLSVLISSVATLLCPMASSWNFEVFVALRVLQGVSYAAALPSLAHMTSNWAKQSEKARFIALGSNCIQFSPIITMPVAGLFCSSRYGWPMAYYTIGILSILTVGLWAIFYQDSPTQHKFISDEEIKEIAVGKLKNDNEAHKVPFRHIFISRSVMAIVIAVFGNMCGIQLILTYLPTYLKTQMNFDIKSLGFVSTLPSFGLMFVKMLAGLMSDKLVCHNDKINMETLKVRLFNTASFLGCASCYVALSTLNSPDQKLIALSLFTLGATLLGFNGGSFFKSVTAVGQLYAGFIMGLVQLTTCLVILVIPYVVRLLCPDGTLDQWRVVFRLVAGLLLVTNAIFCVFGQGIPSSWAGGNPKLISFGLKSAIFPKETQLVTKF